MSKNKKQSHLSTSTTAATNSTTTTATTTAAATTTTASNDHNLREFVENSRHPKTRARESGV